MSRKRRRLSPPIECPTESVAEPASHEDDSTEVKLAILASLHPYIDSNLLLDFLLSADGSVEKASQSLSNPSRPSKKPVLGSLAYQSSLFAGSSPFSGTSPKALKSLTKKGRTLHLYSSEDVAAHTPCSIIHNFLPAQEANDLLSELLLEAPTYERSSFKLFDTVVQSPHTACFYVESLEAAKRQKTEYLYNGAYLSDVRQITPHMQNVSSRVQEAVNAEIAKRIATRYPFSKKLKYQSPDPWIPNAAFVNCYAGGSESVGYHSDQLTYLGPRAVIGSLSLGVAREFRVRRIVPRDDDNDDNNNDGDSKTMAPSSDSASSPTPKDTSNTRRADAEGQISIHLPHNSLLVMHAEMQEEWKHSIAPAPSIDPHPLAGNRRLNVTYRCYRDSFHPRHTPKCFCNVAAVLRCVQRKRENWGRYFWMCHVGAVPEKGTEGCSYFAWAEFDDDGEPAWSGKRREPKG